jgi:hypothetical protein
MRLPSSDVGTFLIAVSIITLVLHMALRQFAVFHRYIDIEAKLLLIIVILIGIVAWMIAAPAAERAASSNQNTTLSPQPPTALPNMLSMLCNGSRFHDVKIQGFNRVSCLMEAIAIHLMVSR